nr:MAG TPA: hypothetical protein [Inoviridae sp.]
MRARGRPHTLTKGAAPASPRKPHRGQQNRRRSEGGDLLNARSP